VLARLRFEDFEIDSQANELRRGRARVELAPQAVRALAILASRSGELVRREELYHALWAGAPVDVDRGLNTLIRQIRLALNDDPSSPRYVRTYPRRGYRFLVPLDPPSHSGTPEHRPARADSRLVVRLVAVAAGLALAGAIAVSRSARPMGVDPEPPVEVRDTFLMARHLLQAGNLSRRTDAVPLLEAVVRRDPLFAAGHGNLAAAFFWAGRWDEARAAARKALTLDHRETVALLVEGSLSLMLDWNWSQAESLLQRAAERAPADAAILAGRAFVRITAGRSGEAMVDLRRAELADPIAAWIVGDLGLMYLYAGDFESAATTCEHAATLEPEAVHPLACAFSARVALADTTAALGHAGRLIALFGADPRSILGAQPATRREAVSRFLLWRAARAQQILRAEPRAAFSAALVLAEAGLDSAALDALARATSQRDPGLVTATVDPRLRSLYATSGFQQIVAPLVAAGARSPGRSLALKRSLPANSSRRQAVVAPSSFRIH
jgi:DNA-binding winged helix-turn-helix (wHTH) protein/Flp pilus assembly protein TadD